MKNIFDLQIFAYDPQAQPANNTEANGETPNAKLTPEMKTFYEKELIRYAKPNLVHSQFGKKKNIPKNHGKKIEFRYFEKLPKITAPLTEGVTPDPQNLRVGIIEATVLQYGGFVPLTDLLTLTAIDPMISETTQLIGDQAGLSIDTVVRNALQSGTVAAFADKISGSTKTPVKYRYDLDATAKLSVDGVEQVVRTLKRNNAKKINGSYVAIVHPDVVYDLRRDPDFVEAVDYGRPEDLYNSEVGKLAGVRFVESTEAKIYKAADLLPTARTLTVSSVNQKVITVAETLVADALIGREVIIHGVHNKITDNDTSTITVENTPTGATSSDVIYPGEGAQGGLAVYGCLFMGDDAYATSEIEGGNLEILIANKEASVADPLAQRSTVGWKATQTAEILNGENLVRFECVSSNSDTAVAN